METFWTARRIRPKKNFCSEAFRGPRASLGSRSHTPASPRSHAMKLHTFVGSPNSHKVEAVIRHLGLEVDIHHHDPLAGDLRRPEYLALNPNGKVPVLEDGGFVLSESNAIMQYLADKASDSSLFPRDPQLRADVARWQFWELAHFNGAFRVLVIETVIKPLFKRGPTNQALDEAAQADSAGFAPGLEQPSR